jgi:hypothetical protein
MTFSEYIRSRRVTDTPRGDFIADTKSLIETGKFPDVESWTALELELAGRGACREAFREARKLWREYQYQGALTVEDILS